MKKIKEVYALEKGRNFANIYPIKLNPPSQKEIFDRNALLEMGKDFNFDISIYLNPVS